MQTAYPFVLISVLIGLCLVGCHDSPYMQGKRLYESKCQNCHMEDGTGLGKLIPGLEKSGLLGSPEMACLIIRGKKDSFLQNNQYVVRDMPGFPDLSATEVTNLVNFINHKFQPDFSERTINQINQDLKPCLSDY